MFSETFNAIIPAAKFLPTFDVIEALKLAQETPRENGRVKSGQLAKVFSTWRAVVYGELLKGLTPEREAAVSQASTEAFEVMLANLLDSMVTHDIGTGEKRHSIGAWARRYAEMRPGKWCRVSSYNIWGRISENRPQNVTDDDGFEIAVRPRLASQIHRGTHPELAKMPLSELTALCKRHNVWAPANPETPDDNRISDGKARQRVVVLSNEFVASVGLSNALNNEIAEALKDTYDRSGCTNTENRHGRFKVGVKGYRCSLHARVQLSH